MENSTFLNFEAILSFLESLSLIEQTVTLNHLIDGCLFQKMLSNIQQYSFDKQKLVPASNWVQALNNNKIFINHLTKFHSEFFHKELDIEDLDLIGISKRRDKQEVSKLFFLVLATLVQSTSKQYFISKLTSLDSEHQKYFMHKIQCYIQTSIESSQVNKQLYLLGKVSEVQQQNLELRKQLNLILQQSSKLKATILELESKVAISNSEIERFKLQKQQEQKEKTKKVPKYELKTIQNLKQKIKTMVIEHQKQLSKYQQEVSLLAEDKYRIIELQKMVENYKQNYDQAIQHMKQINNWNNQKYKITKQIQQKNSTIKQLQQLIEDSNNKIQQLQEQLLELQISHQKLILKNNELQQKLVSKKASAPRLSLAIDTTTRTLSQLIPQTNQQNINHQLQKQLDTKNKKVMSLEKEIEKLRFKVDRVSQIEKEKTRLEGLIMEQNQSRLDQIQLLTSCLYDLRLRYKSLYEETKGKI